MGFAVIGGMTAATVIAIFLIPVLFYAVETLAKPKNSVETIEAKGEGHE
jgi:HAE1 family hydrophobic/amphiphilic exporter-1